MMTDYRVEKLANTVSSYIVCFLPTSTLADLAVQEQNTLQREEIKVLQYCLKILRQTLKSKPTPFFYERGGTNE